MCQVSVPTCCSQNCMTKDVFNQLQKISVQQSKIKSVKSRLSVYQDVANKHAETFAELQLVKRVPVAYRHCLAECMRRFAFRLYRLCVWAPNVVFQLAGFALQPSHVAFWPGDIAFWPPTDCLLACRLCNLVSTYCLLACRHCLMVPTCCLLA